MVQVITLLAQRETTILNAHAKVTKATLEREAKLTEKQTEIITAKLKAESARATVLTQARSEVNKASSERLARLTEARVRNSEQTLAAQRSRGVVLIEAAAEVGKAKAQRVALVTAAETQFEKEKIELLRARESALTAAKGRLAAAQLARVAALTQARAALTATKTREAEREVRARSLALIELLKGNATAAEIREAVRGAVSVHQHVDAPSLTRVCVCVCVCDDDVQRAAALTDLKGQKEAQAKFVELLKSEAGLSEEQALRFLHLDALSRVAAAKDTTLFLDYNKVPLMLEAQQGETTVNAGVDVEA